MKKVLIGIAIFVFLLLVGAGAVLWWGYSQVFNAQSKEEKEVVVQVAESESMQSIASNLKEKGLVNIEKLFLWYAGFSGKDKTVKPGIYSLYTNMNMPDMLDALSSGKTKNVWFTIPEGWTLNQIAVKLEGLELFTKDDFIKEAVAGNFTNDFLAGLDPATSLEGYLFPDTYKVEVKTTPKDVISKMLENFGKKIADLKSEIQAQGKSIYDVVIMASIIDREAAKVDDQKMVASVFYNRLTDGWMLQSCATLQYITGTTNRYLTEEETKDPSPYNTYNHAGLPPGPIGNPGLSALEASVSPAQSNNYFFLSDVDGNTYFSETEDEHNRKAQIYVGDQ